MDWAFGRNQTNRSTVMWIAHTDQVKKILTIV